MRHLIRSIGLVSCLVAGVVNAQERVNGAIQNHGFFQQSISPEEISVDHGSEFKGAHKIAVSVFNVAFPHENHFTATTKGRSFLGGMTSSAQSSMSTTMSGVDRATQQRITDAAYAYFVEQMTGAGYEVVDNAELARLSPEFAKWEALPNFSEGRFGTYVAPTGMALRFLQGDTAKRDTSGALGQQMSMFRVLDTPLAFARSPYVAHEANLGIVAVTLVVDYGVYSSSGNRNKLGGSASTGFLPGVAIAAGNRVDHGSLLQYWGPNSGGFPAYAYLQQPVQSRKPFATVNGIVDADLQVADQDLSLVADPAKFEAAANEVTAIALPKLVSVMAAAR